MKLKNHTPETVGQFLRKDKIMLYKNESVSKVLEIIHTTNISDQITYFYVTNEEQKIVGVVPLRRLISSDPNQIIEEIMIENVVTISEDDTIEKAYALFSSHKYLSLPVIDKEKKFIGVIDITALTGKKIDLKDTQSFDFIFETIGLRSSILPYMTPFSAFQRRFLWLIPTLMSGIFCAILASFFEKTLAEIIVLAFFMTLMLGLGESVSIQSLTLTIRKLHIETPTWKWFKETAYRELSTASLLGLGVGSIVMAIVYLWMGTLLTGVTICLSIILSLVTASFFGLSIPAILHKTKLDPKVSAGPLVLASADIFTLFFYFTLAYLLIL